MRLNSIRLANFRQHADTRIEFDTGLTGIIGPNGSGKTTILEAIAWAIYGNAAARGKRESIRFVRAAARAPVEVTLDFELGGHRYRVVRGLTGAEVYLDGADAPIANSITGVTELLQRRLGMSRDEFFNTYFTGQKELSVMAAMGPSQRAQFLSHVLGYERLRGAQVLLRERRSAIVAQVTGLKQGMPDPDVVDRLLMETESRLTDALARVAAAGEQQSRATSELAVVTPKWLDAQRERDALLALVAELRVVEGELGAFTRDLERLDRDLAEMTAARTERGRLDRELEPFVELAAESQRLEVLAREDGRRRALQENLVALRDELARLDERRTRLESAPALEREFGEALAAKNQELELVDGQLEARRTEWVRDRQEAETKRQALRDQYGELKQQRDRLASAGETEICPTCMRPLGGSLQSVLEMLDAQMETMRVDGNYYKARLEQLHDMPAEVKELDDRRRALVQEVSGLERKLTKVQLAVGELAQLGGERASKEARRATIEQDVQAIPAGYDAERHEHVRRERERLALIESRITKLDVQIEREPTLLGERHRVLEQLRSIEARLVTLRAHRESLEQSEGTFAELRARFERATASVRAAELASVSAAGDASGARTGREMAEQSARELAERQRALAELNSERRLHDELDRGFTDLRTDLNFQLRPELSELASAFLTELTDGRYSELELDDQYNIIVLEDGVPKPVISGGEEDLSNLVLRLAISQMIAERAGQPFSLLILDEIFGSLDDLRRANVLELLRRLEDRFEQVIVITHIDAVRDGLDHVITVRYDEERGASSVEQSAGAARASELADFGEPSPRLLESAGAGD